MAGVGEAPQWFSYAERVEFQRVFELVAGRLPGMFRSFWHRWELVESLPPALVVYAENGSEVLRVTRCMNGVYRVAGITGQGCINYTDAAPSLLAAVKAAGLI